MEKIDINEIVKIEQMPKVFSQLEEIGKLIDKSTKDLDKLECTDDNKQEVKNRRTEINKTLEALEDRRKEIKNKLLEPYDVFEEKYNKECKEKLQNASNLLKNKVDEIEKKQKQEKQEELELFVKQHISANNLDDIIKFEDIGLNITLSASMKSLKDKVLEFIKKVSDDLECISSEENRDEVLYEYQHNGFDYSKAVLNVRKKQEEINKLKEQQEQIQEQEKEEEKIIEKVEEITAPKEIIEDDEVITVSFKVTGTKDKIKQIKNLIIELGVEYE